MEVNRYLENKAMDNIDHALGRPVDPMSKSYRNYFYVMGDTELRRYFAGSSHWQSEGKVTNGEYFSVTDDGRRALASHLKQIGDKNRRWMVSWGGYDMNVVAESRSKARYIKWLELDMDISFRDFFKSAKVRLA